MSSTRCRRLVLVILFSAIAVSLTACAQRFRRFGGGSDEIHRVRYQGETLGIISEWYTGTDANWRQLAARNPSVNPLSMQVGERIVIPGELVRRRGELSREYVIEHASSKSNTRSARLSSPKGEHDSQSANVPPDEVVSSEEAAPAPTPVSDHDLDSEVLRDRLEEGLLKR